MESEKFELQYSLNDKPCFSKTIIAGLQHMLSMFAGIIAPPLIVAQYLGFDSAETTFFLSMALFVSGIATFIQVKKIGPVGSGLLSVQGTSFTFVPACILAGSIGGPALIFGMSIAMSFLEMSLSFVLKYVQKIFPPIISGTVVMLIGLTLIKISFFDLAGGLGSPEYGSYKNWIVGIIVLISVAVLSRSKNKILSSSCVFMGMILGFIISILFNMVDFSGISSTGWLTIPVPLKYGLAFRTDMMIPFGIAYLITTIEATGDITATSIVSNEPVVGEKYAKRVSGGVLADSINSIIAGFLNTLPNTTFSQNNGLIQLTKIASRKVGFAVAGMLVLLGLFPKFSAIITIMPKCVLGGATLVMFGFIVIGGIRIVVRAGLNGRNATILAVSLGLGLGVEFAKDALHLLPNYLQSLFSSGISTGAITAILLNFLIRKNADS